MELMLITRKINKTRERNQKTVYSPGAINEQVFFFIFFFFLETSGQRQTSVVTQYILSDGEATTRTWWAE